MENDVKEFLSELLKQLKSIDYIKPEDIPNIDLYMGQVTTFMDEQLAASCLLYTSYSVQPQNYQSILRGSRYCRRSYFDNDGEAV